MGQTQPCCLFVYIKFYWNAATPIHACVVYDGVCAVKQLWQRPDVRTADLIYHLAFFRKLANLALVT